MKRIIIDLDNTLTIESEKSYSNKDVNKDVVEACRKFKKLGFEIIIHTARNMSSYKGNLGKINVHTLPKILSWLDKHQVPYDEVIVGKPWCGEHGFYVDDRAIRPSEFSKLSHEEIKNIIDMEINYEKGN